MPLQLASAAVRQPSQSTNCTWCDVARLMHDIPALTWAVGDDGPTTAVSAFGGCEAAEFGGAITLTDAAAPSTGAVLPGG